MDEGFLWFEARTTRAGGPLAVPSTRNCPIWVVLPLPVSPWTKITWLEAKSFASSSFTSQLENGCSCPIHQTGQPSYFKRISRRCFGFTIKIIHLHPSYNSFRKSFHCSVTLKAGRASLAFFIFWPWALWPEISLDAASAFLWNVLAGLTAKLLRLFATCATILS